MRLKYWHMVVGTFLTVALMGLSAPGQGNPNGTGAAAVQQSQRHAEAVESRAEYRRATYTVTVAIDERTTVEVSASCSSASDGMEWVAEMRRRIEAQ